MRQPILMLFFFAVAMCGAEVYAAGKESTVTKEPRSPAESPSCPSLPYSSTKLPEAFLFIAEYGPLEWPAGSRRIRSMRIEANGQTQYAERDDSGIVLTIRDGSTGRFHLFDDLIAVWPPPVQTPQDEPETLGEDHPGYLLLWFISPGEKKRFWEGSEQLLSVPWRESLAGAWAAMEGLSKVEVSGAAAWLLTASLDSATARKKEQAGVVQTIDDVQLESSPLLKQSLCQPFRLLPIPEGTNPFSVLGWHEFTAGQSVVNLGWHDEVYHVRPLRNGVR